MATDNHLDLSTLGHRLRFRRKEKGLTQEQLAVRADTSQAVIQKIENGKSLRPRKLDQIAAALGINPAWLMFGNERGGTLPVDVMAIADEWSRLPEPHKSRIRQKIIDLSR